MTRKKTWERKKIVTLPPSYTRAPGSICTISLVVIHKGIEVIVVWIGSPISALSVWLGKQIDQAVINHMPQGICIFHRSEDCKLHQNVPIGDRDHIGLPDNDVPCDLALIPCRYGRHTWDRRAHGD